MNTQYAIVVDKDGHKAEFVLMVQQEVNGTECLVPYAYTMRPGEKLIYDDVNTAISMVKPRWTGTSWEDTATPEELAANAPPEPVQPEPDLRDLALAELSMLVAEMQQQNDQAMAEITMMMGGMLHV